jgi:hypothetical protein
MVKQRHCSGGVWGELLPAAGFEVVRRCGIVYELCYVKICALSGVSKTGSGLPDRT